MLRIEPLDASHDRKRFDCGSAPLNEYLQRIARQHQEKSVSRTYVLIDDLDTTSILGFYTLAICEVESESIPPDFARRLPRRIPGVRIGRLATDLRHRGNGYGDLLLINALERVAKISRELAIAAVFVDAKNEDAKRFYLKYGFVALPGDELKIMMPIREVNELL